MDAAGPDSGGEQRSREQASIEALSHRLQSRFAGLFNQCAIALGEITLELPVQHLVRVCRALRDEPEFAFKQLVDLCGVDYLSYGRSDWETSEMATSTGFSRAVEEEEYTECAQQQVRFAVVYHLLSHTHNQRLRLRVYTDSDPPKLPSVVEIWNVANWYEREAFDLYGILFEGHPDLRRLLTDYGFIGHPFRKDFPLIGRVEMRYDPEKQRVVYEPVSIEPRTLVPRVIRAEHQQPQPSAPEESGDA
ncbi:MAG: NADH-quinone oxidoreductase subunit C [Gammaproteobacteria bacterium]|jgi:NADH-quinone oxidoreductase subunit C